MFIAQLALARVERLQEAPLHEQGEGAVDRRARDARRSVLEPAEEGVGGEMLMRIEGALEDRPPLGRQAQTVRPEELLEGAADRVAVHAPSSSSPLRRGR